MVGHGMNAEELGANRRLSRFFVKNLNENPTFAAADQSFDAVLCCVSVQYLQRPEEVFAEVYRILKPGGVCVISFSNRLFYEKAIASWRDASGYNRAQLVKEYFGAVEGFTKPEVITEVGSAPDGSILGKLRRFVTRTQSDPFSPSSRTETSNPCGSTPNRDGDVERVGYRYTRTPIDRLERCRTRLD